MCWERFGVLGVSIDSGNVGDSTKYAGCGLLRITNVGSIYQEYLAKTLTDKYGALNAEVDRITNEANSQLERLTQQISRLLANL